MQSQNNFQDWEPVIWKKESGPKPVIKENTEAPRVMTMKLQKAIQQARLNVKMSQKELAQKLDVFGGFLSKIFEGTTVIKSGNVYIPYNYENRDQQSKDESITKMSNININLKYI